MHGPRGAGGLVFVVEQEGTIRMIRDGKKLSGTFLDISDRVLAGGERGLLSVAFHPGYGRNRLFYVYFTDEQGDIVVQEYRRSRSRPQKADAGSGRTVIEIPHRSASNHNGGQLQFGPDGFLYLGTGDGGGAGDTEGNAQNLDVLLGKLLRIDPRRQKNGKPYGIPASNPFVGRAGADEIYSYGLRNPWRFSFDRTDGTLVIGDVGQGELEEIDYTTIKGASGANFGWNVFEGSQPYEGGGLPNHTGPIHEYGHDDGSCSITGGYVVRDRRLDSLFGRYVYGDICRGELFSLIPDPSGARDNAPIGLPNQSGVSSFGTDQDDRLYLANLNSGTVYLFKPAAK